MALDISINNIIHDAVLSAIDLDVIDDIPVVISDVGAAGNLVEGKLQEDPTADEINLIVTSGGEDRPDQLYTPDKRGTTGFATPLFEIGSNVIGSRTFEHAATWKRVIVVKMQIYLPGKDTRIQARQEANRAASRLYWAIATMSMPQEIDTYGEQVYYHQVESMYLNAGGGTGTHIYRGEMVVAFLTNTNPQNLKGVTP